MHHLWFVGNARDLYIVREFVLTEIVKNLVHLTAILQHIVAGIHFHRQEHTGMTVLLYATRHRFVFPNHSGNITHTDHLARYRVRKDNLVGYFVLAIVLSLYVDRYLLIVVIDAAAHRGDALGLQTRKEHLLPHPISLQPLTVDIE